MENHRPIPGRIRFRVAFDPFLVELGFESLKSDTFVYVYHKNDTTTILTLYVDDLLLGEDIVVLDALAMKEAVFCSNMMTEIGFGANFSSVPLYIDNTATLHVIGNRTYSVRTKHVALRFFYIRELVKKERCRPSYCY